MKMKTYPESKEIMFLKADINYTEFHLVDGRKIVSSYTLKTFVQQHSNFIRINRGTLLNPSHIKTIERDGNRACISLYNGSHLWVSRRRMYHFNI
ncbi:LytR/AlgR family response regulator transcription factor [Lacihabitans lacunae]|uniref:LytR/AlgR family response regulator transcription factor n=1 Tax=Lacihabitans lacunae TaxID=1028214 RepID=A0ABV7YV91_9BACT